MCLGSAWFCQSVSGSVCVLSGFRPGSVWVPGCGFWALGAAFGVLGSGLWVLGSDLWALALGSELWAQRPVLWARGSDCHLSTSQAADALTRVVLDSPVLPNNIIRTYNLSWHSDYSTISIQFELCTAFTNYPRLS